MRDGDGGRRSGGLSKGGFDFDDDDDGKEASTLRQRVAWSGPVLTRKSRLWLRR